MMLLTAELILTYLATILALAAAAFTAGGTLGAWTAWLALPVASALIYWRQNFPGLDNRQKDELGKPMKNWWPFLFY